MSDALKGINARKTAQTSRANKRQVKNNAGGYVYQVSDKARLERFLILGVDGGTYYVSQKKLTEQNVEFVREQLESNAREVIDTVVDVSVNARAKSNSQALFVLALAMNTGGVDRRMVSDAVQKVARTSTHLFEYMSYLENLGGWGRAKRNSVAQWYTDKTPSQLGYQLVKFRQRDGWTHRDAIRLSHPKGLSNGLVNFTLGKQYYANEVPSIVIGFDKAQGAQTEQQVIVAIHEYGLPWEAVPTQWHKSLKVWQALFEVGMGQSALVRNVTRFAKLDAFNDVVFAKQYADKLTDADAIKRGKVHPINYLNASVVYEEGQVDRNNSSLWYPSRNKSWGTNPKIAAALDDGFELAFANVEPSDKRTLVALDVSGSMSCLANGLELSCAQVSGAVAMFIARKEPYSIVRGFSHQFKDLGISERDSLPTVMRKISNQNFGRTDCSLPMTWAQENKVDFDTFVVITDNETWSGRVHPDQALRSYRQSNVSDAKLAVLGVAASPFTIADPQDDGMMDFVGFDAAAPRVLADFSAGRL